MILKEGGNVFKKVEGDQVIPLTTRIATPKVRPTVAAIEKIVGLEFVDDDLLGTTGKKVDPDGSFELNSSGDLDLNTDNRKISKEQLIAKLTAWAKKQGFPDDEIMNVGKKFTSGWIKDAGDQVHLRMPIVGYDGYVQVDFMLTDDPDFQRGSKRGGTAEYSGKDRAVLHRKSHTGYSENHLNSMLWACGSITLVVYALYAVEHSTFVMYSVVPATYGIFRFIYLTDLGKGSDPIKTLFSDRLLLLTTMIFLLFLTLVIY